MTNTDKILAEFSRLKARKERVNEGMCATCGSKENHNKVGKFGTFTHQWDNGGDAIMFNEIDFLATSITQAIAEERERERERGDSIKVKAVEGYNQEKIELTKIMREVGNKDFYIQDEVSRRMQIVDSSIIALASLDKPDKE